MAADLTVEDVAAQLGVVPETVRRLLRDGKLRGYRAGGRKAGWRIRPSDVVRYIASQSNSPQSDERHPIGSASSDSATKDRERQ